MEALVVNLVRRSEAAIGALVDKYQAKMMKLALKITQCPEDAEEVVQDSLYTIITKAHEFRGGSAFGTWVYIITKRFALMKLRKRAQNPTVPLEDAPISVFVVEPRLDGAVYLAEALLALSRSIEIIPDYARSAYLLRDICGIGTNKIADTMGITRPAAKSRIRKARAIIRENMKQFLEAA